MNDASNPGVGSENTGIQTNSAVAAPTTPVVEQSVPVAVAAPTTPVVEQNVPAAVAAPTMPVVEQSVPVAVAAPTTPVVEQSVPAAVAVPTTPVVEQSVPVAVAAPTTPVVEQSVPVAVAAPTTPVVEQSVPAAVAAPTTPVVETIVSQPNVQIDEAITPVIQSNEEKIENNVESGVNETPIVTSESQSSTILPVEEAKVETFTPFNINKSSDDIEADLYVPQDETEDNNISSHKENSDEIKLEAKGNRKLPVVVLAIFVAMLSVVLVYYFIVMTPERVFDKAINNAIDSVEDIVKGYENPTNDTVGFTVNTDMTTKDPSIEYLNGLHFDGIIDVDLKRMQGGVKLTSENAGLPQYDADAYLIDGAMFLSNAELKDTYDDTDVVYKYKESNFAKLKYDRIKDSLDAFDLTKKRILEIIDDSKLERKFASKKVGEQTTLALKVTCTLDNADVTKIYMTIFKEWLNKSKESEEQLKKLAVMFGTDTETVRKKIEEFIKRDVVTQRIFINLYMNLANTELISLDVTVDKYYVEINNLNGLYIAKIKYGPGIQKENENVTLDIGFEYDNNKGILTGKGIIDNEDTYLLVDFNYVRRESEDTRRKVGNKLTLYFYRGKDKKDEDVIALLDCSLEIRTNADVKILGNEHALSDADITDTIVEKVDDSIGELTHYVQYMFRWLLYNRLNDDDFIKKYDELDEDAVIKFIAREGTTGADVIVQRGNENYRKPTPKEEVSTMTEEEAAEILCSGMTGEYTHQSYTGITPNTCVDITSSVSKEIKATAKNKWACCKEETEEEPTTDPTEETPTEETQKITSVTISGDKKVEVGSTITLTAKCEPSDLTCTITWSTSDKKIATVKNGVVTGVKAGTATITAKDVDGAKATYKITVNKKEEEVDPRTVEGTPEYEEVAALIESESEKPVKDYAKLCHTYTETLNYAYDFSENLARENGWTTKELLNKVRTNTEERVKNNLDNKTFEKILWKNCISSGEYTLEDLSK